MLIEQGLEVLDERQCRRLLAGSSVGRVAVAVDSVPVVLTVNYRLIDDAIVFRTGKGAKLDAAAMTSRVAFQVDGGLDPQYREGWSVLCVGLASIVGDEAQLERLRALLPEPWAPGQRHTVIRITIEALSGRRIVRVPADPPDAVHG